ncbi:E [Symbiodinium sp. KB8]|nr:E [Symbiodinium sp. KB8] [Symbiodinium sp. KB8]
MRTIFAAVIAAAIALPAVMACESATALIEAAEGYRDCTYVDTTGHKTICYGFNLAAGGAKSKVESVGGNWDRVYNHCACGTSGAGCLNQHQCAELLSGAVSAAEAGARRVFGNQCPCIMAVLTDMTYNLGEGGISSFTTFKRYIEEQNWSAAASDLKGTLWCRQVKSRCTRDVGIIARGC